jgi:cysteinyl-tRNA synthetase
MSDDDARAEMCWPASGLAPCRLAPHSLSRSSYPTNAHGKLDAHGAPPRPYRTAPPLPLRAEPPQAVMDAAAYYPWAEPGHGKGVDGGAAVDPPRLYLLNSLTGTKTPFRPAGGGNRVTWYICGPTVYDSAHIGHASNYVRFDIVRRLLSDYFGYEVVVQMNVTDVDDKIILRANERGIEFDELSREFEAEFLEDLELLNVRPADYVTRVSEYVPEVVEYVQRIINNGFGYESDGSVYFDTTAFVEGGHNYGKLEPWSVGNGELLAEGEGRLTSADEGVKRAKRAANDFVLWKKSKPNEPTWESPWGPGRPGWHIECSAMASNVLGPEIDIHVGGVDLRFPHHSNEIAQAEAYHQCDQWINYFLHSGHLHIDGLKMSKSLKNFTTIRDCLKEFNARQLRLLFLGHRYDAPMHYAKASMLESVALDRTFIDFFGNLKAALRDVAKKDRRALRLRPGDAEVAVMKKLERHQSNVHAALRDNLDTQTALSELRQLVTTTNAYIESGEVNPVTLSTVGRYLTKMFRVFGLTPADGKEIGYGESSGGAAGGESREDIIGPVLDAFASFRDSVRSISRTEKAPAGKELLVLSDEVRDTVLPPLGVRLEDRGEGQGSKWILEDAAALMMELKRKNDEEATRAEEKVRLKAAKLEKELGELEKGRATPECMFRSGEYAGKYSSYDETGMPLTDASGAELPKSARKGLEKLRKIQTKLHGRYLAAVECGRIKGGPSSPIPVPTPPGATQPLLEMANHSNFA